MGFLEWAARAEHAEVEHGTDSHLIRGERVAAQTLH